MAISLAVARKNAMLDTLTARCNSGKLRIYESDGTTVVYQGSVGTSGADLNLNSTSINAGVQVQVTSLSLSL